MAVDQIRINDIISAASADDPAVKLQNLEREIDLIKGTIKRLLMDIRERMNELENPFTLVSSGAPASTQKINDKDTIYQQSVLDARESALELLTNSPTKPHEKQKTDTTDPAPGSVFTDHQIPDNTIPVPENGGPSQAEHNNSPRQSIGEVLPLPKAYNLFCWTQSGVKKFGHDQLGILVESYRVMGYISKITAEEIQQISRLMPENLEDVREIGPDQFVLEIYTLNRILSPGDTSLDRDMIEVLMEQRRQEHTGAKVSGYRDSIPGTAMDQGKASSFEFGKRDRQWMNLQA